AERGLDRGEGRLCLRTVRAPGFRRCGTPAAFSPQYLAALARKIDRAKAGCQIVRHPDNETGFAVLRDADQRDHAGAELLLAFVGEAFQILDVDAFDRARHQLDVADHAHAVRFAARFGAAAHRELLARVGEITFEPL